MKGPIAHSSAKIGDFRWIGGVSVFLRARPSPAHCPPARQLALHRAGAAAGELDQLSGEETAFRLVEQLRQHALLDGRKQRIGQAGAPLDLGNPDFRFRTQNRHIDAHIGYVQEDGGPGRASR